MSFRFSPPSYYYSSSSDLDTQAQNTFDKFDQSVDSTMKWAVAGSVVYGVVVIIAIIAIAYAIIECLKKAGTVIPAYTQLPTTENDHKASKSLPSPSKIEVVIPPDSIVPGSKAEFATMERFLSNINREKPIRFSPEQLDGVTKNYSTILGSGAFGVVFKGELPNGELVAVKVLNCLDMGMEEQFKAEVGTIGRTYHINLVRLYGFCFHMIQSSCL
uniref:Protein kinase domain-containing protein n=1 Tax=Lotus japonicus TaxID=34305 RepID=I3SD03_LOTJA|nr:unknown [Lotus japonicus]